jgi:hypothetical protein
MHKPFAVLEDLIRSGRVKFADANAGSLDGEQRDFAIPVLPAGMADEDLFSHAMHDVKALGWSAVPLHHRPPLEIVPQNDEEEALRALEKFLKSGDVEIEYTPEDRPNRVAPMILRPLKSGQGLPESQPTAPPTGASAPPRAVGTRRRGSSTCGCLRAPRFPRA